MNPAKPKEIYKEVAQRIPYSEEVVQYIVSTYYQLIRDKVTSAKNLRVEIRKLGYFTFKHWEIDKIIERFEQAVIDSKEGSFIQKDRKKKLEEMKRLAGLRDKMKSREKSKKIEKKEYAKKNKIKKVWENRKQIAEGVTNRVFKKDYVEEIAFHRMEICKSNVCGSFDTTGDGCMYKGTQPCCDKRTGGCGCDLESATRAITTKDCPKGYWSRWSEEEVEEFKKTLQ